MGLGDLFSAVIKIAALPISIAEEMLGEEGAIKDNIQGIKEDLNEVISDNNDY